MSAMAKKYLIHLHDVKATHHIAVPFHCAGF
jgi:hypothetical protein